jgi:hypothetical protein
VSKVVKHNCVKNPSYDAEYLVLYPSLNFFNFHLCLLLMIFYLFINTYSSQFIFIRCIYKFFLFSLLIFFIKNTLKKLNIYFLRKKNPTRNNTVK